MCPMVGFDISSVFFVIPFYLKSVPVHSANCVKTYTMACGGELISTPLHLHVLLLDW
jgi:hypothetical protein